MTWHDKVMWTEGMFLQPQHFQQQDRHAVRLLDARVGAAFGHGRGFSAWMVDEAALLQGKVALVSATGVLPDGQPFAVPQRDPAPPALDVPPDARDELVVLALALARPGVA